MGITVDWDNAEHTVLLFVYQGYWTWSEFHETLDQSLVMIKSVPHLVDHIYDVTNSVALPSGALSQFRSLRNRSSVKGRRRVLVGASILTTVLSNAMLRLYPGLKENFLVAATLEEARLLLVESKPTSTIS